MGKKKPYGISLDSEIKKIGQKQAKKNRRSFTAWIEDLILEKEKKEPLQKNLVKSDD